ncbi:hypothetical protein BDF21DRAFT_339074, partial [Thamnidium elegans]
LHHCLSNSEYKSLLNYEDYQEITANTISVLNMDWKIDQYYRIVCGFLLSGTIFVEGREILLINCIELYNRKPSIDLHFEKFGATFNKSSVPTLNNRYKKVNVIKRSEDESEKLIIDTLVFNGPVTSSLRLAIQLRIKSCKVWKRLLKVYKQQII